jgi:hypothetical protein
MESDDRHSNVHGKRLVELTRVQPIEAEVIVARLRASGIPATASTDPIYPSLSVADGVPVFVPEEDVPQAAALLKEADESQ